MILVEHTEIFFETLYAGIAFGLLLALLYNIIRRI